jgi:hypothetical protein
VQPGTKPLSPTLQRSFVVTLQNLTSRERTFRLTVTQPPAGQASFLQTSLQATLDVTIAAVRRRAPVRDVSNLAAGFTVNGRAGVCWPGRMGRGPVCRWRSWTDDRRHRDARDLHPRLPGLEPDPNPFLNIPTRTRSQPRFQSGLGGAEHPNLNISNTTAANPQHFESPTFELNI